MSKPQHTAVCAVYLYDAVLEYMQRGRSEPWGDATSGHLGFVDRLTDYAVVLADFLDADLPDFPGVFHYEVTPMLAEYMIDTKPWPTPEQFRAEIERVFDLWLKEYEQQ